MPSNSPYFGAPPRNQPLEQLAEDNPEEYLRYLNQKRDTREDYKDSHFARKHPTRSGIPGKSF